MELGCIRYYKDRSDTRKVLGEVHLDLPCTTLLPTPAISPSLKRTEKEKIMCTLQVQTPARIYRMTADTPEEKEEWSRTIQNVLDAFKAASSPKPATPTPDVHKVSEADFDMIKMIGKGNFGKVFLVRAKANGALYAMKVLSKIYIVQKNEVEHTMSECNILQQIEHPFLVKLHYSFQNPENLFLILDFVNGGELFFHLARDKKFTEERVRYYAAEIMLGLEHLHNNSIIYRDIKLENLLVSREGHIVITDFGLSKQGRRGAETVRTGTFCGTPEYMAPEMLAQPGALYGKEVDWWSYGSLLYEMLTGLPPFFNDDVQEMYRKILMDPLTFPSYVSPLAQDFIARCLEKDPTVRLSDPNLMKRHKWFDGISWQDLFMKKIPPPFLPPVRGPEDTSLIDPVFTSEAVSLAPDPPDEGEVPAEGAPDIDTQLRFAGFSYVKPTAPTPVATKSS